MIAVDTNVLVRYAVKDDRHQTVLATGILAGNECFVPKTVLLELAWVLSSPAGYGLPRELVAGRLRHVLGLPNVRAEDAPCAAQAIDGYEAGMDFADAMHLAGSGESTGLATFDRKLAKAAERLAVHPPVRLLE